MSSALIAFAFSVFATLSPDDQAALRDCGVDAAALDAYLQLDQRSFDQDLNGGWREVSEREGCGLGAAVLIKAYILYSHPYPPADHGILRWHAGQVLATDGHNARAVAFFQGAYQRGPGEGGSDWDQYVDATIAFLEGDREALIAARDRLAVMTPDEETMQARQAFLDDNPELGFGPQFVTEPMNFSVVQALVACFGRPYAEAYGSCDVE